MEQSGGEAGGKEDVNEGLMELQKEAFPSWHTAFGGDDVGAIFLLAAGHFFGVETELAIGTEELDDLVGGEVVPTRGRGGCRGVGLHHKG
jgi:hypothetical protein